MAHESTSSPQGGPVMLAEQEVDVAVLGAGLAGLATAYALTVADPSLRVTVGAGGAQRGWGTPGRGA